MNRARGSRRMRFTSIRRVFPAFLFFKHLCFAYCLAPQETAAAASAPGLIPICALFCVESFIASDYPPTACPDWSLDCLCRTNTTTGFTLGEAALRCMVASCPKEVLNSSNAYKICDSVPGAVSETHSAITATVFSIMYYTTDSASQARTTAGPGSGSISPSSVAPLTSMQTTSLAGTASSTGMPMMTTTQMPVVPGVSSGGNQSSRSGVVTSSTRVALPLAENMRSINKPAIIGISVASGLSAAFTIGVAVYFCYRKAKRCHRCRVRRETFEIGGAMSEPPNFGLILPRRLPPASPSAAPISGLPQRPKSPYEQASSVQHPLLVVSRPEDADAAAQTKVTTPRVGQAVSPDSDMGDSPSSLSSQRTLSQLLPDKPNYYDLYPDRWRVSRSGGKPRPSSEETIFEEDFERPRSLLGAPNGFTAFAGAAVLEGPVNKLRNGLRNGPHGNPRRVGLPAHPRAMFNEAEPGTERRAAHGATADEDNLSSSNPSRLPGLLGFPRPPMQSKENDFETIELDSSHSGMRHGARHPQPLSPVREAPTPTSASYHVQPGGSNSTSNSNSTSSSSSMRAKMTTVPGSPAVSTQTASPMERNVTPSRRGADLILRID